MTPASIQSGMVAIRRSKNDRARSLSHEGVVISADVRYAYVRWDSGRTIRILITAIEPKSEATP